MLHDLTGANLSPSLLYPKNRWIEDKLVPLSSSSFFETLQGLRPGVLVRNFFTPTECQKAVEGIMKCSAFSSYAHLDIDLMKLGLCQNECNIPDGKQAYFSKIQEAESLYKQAMGGIELPLERVLSSLRNASRLPCEVAVESGFGRYFAGTIRYFRGAGRTHFDYAPGLARGWDISQVSHQISWNVYFSEPKSGGELIVYETQWSHASLPYRSDSYWYHQQAVSAGKSMTYRPRIGDLVIFNSRNFHEVKASDGLRLSASSFVGLLNDNRLVSWS